MSLENALNRITLPVLAHSVLLSVIAMKTEPCPWGLRIASFCFPSLGSYAASIPSKAAVTLGPNNGNPCKSGEAAEEVLGQRQLSCFISGKSLFTFLGALCQEEV